MNKLLTRIVLCLTVCFALPIAFNLAIAGEATCYTVRTVPQNLEVIDISNVNRILLLAETEAADYGSYFLSPDAEMLIAATSAQAHVYSLTEDSGEASFWENCLQLAIVAWRPNSSQIAFVEHHDSRIRIWDIASNTHLMSFDGQRDEISSLAFDSTGDLIVWAGSNVDVAGGAPWIGDNRVYIFDLQTMTEVAAIEDAAPLVRDVHFSGDSESVIFRGFRPGYTYNDMQVWSLASQTRTAIRESWFTLPAYSRNSPTVVLAVTLSLGITNEFYHQIELWNPQTDSVLWTFALSYSYGEAGIPPQPITAIAQTSDATFVAVGNDEGTITFWDATTGNEITSFQAYSNRVTQLAFTGDDRLIISLGSDGTTDDALSIRFWGAVAQ